jgi:hypothetical protein
VQLLDDLPWADQSMRIRRSRGNSDDGGGPAGSTNNEPIPRSRLILRIVLGLIGVGLGAYELANKIGNTPSTNSTPASVSAITATTGPSAPTTGPNTPTTTAVTLLELSGSGPASSDRFTVPATASQWDIDWSFDCSPATAFLIGVTGFGDAAGTADSGVTEIGTYESGSSPNYDHGQFQLTVTTTTCSWDVEVVLPNSRG